MGKEQASPQPSSPLQQGRGLAQRGPCSAKLLRDEVKHLKTQNAVGVRLEKPMGQVLSPKTNTAPERVLFQRSHQDPGAPLC